VFLLPMITFLDSKTFPLHHLLRLFEQTDWARGRTLEDSEKMLAHTDLVITAWDDENLVGFGRVLTDFVFRASIWDVIVDRPYHNRDIGKGIVHRMLAHPSLKDVELFWLCTRRYQGFYASLGFSDKEQTGMVWDRRKQVTPII
ncbi:MAG: GNAT family N-acetyltransferase, partial [Nitrospira sp.]|nr:GNAT family N-acetyltransferase [Nitrospira sp.]